MNIYVYKLTSRACPSLWRTWSVRANTAEEAMQWQNWTTAPRHDGARLVATIPDDGENNAPPIDQNWAAMRQHLSENAYHSAWEQAADYAVKKFSDFDCPPSCLSDEQKGYVIDAVSQYAPPVLGKLEIAAAAAEGQRRFSRAVDQFGIEY